MLESLRTALRKWLLPPAPVEADKPRAAWRSRSKAQPFATITPPPPPVPAEELEERVNKAAWAVQGGRRRLREQMIQRHRKERTEWYEAMRDAEPNGNLFSG